MSIDMKLPELGENIEGGDVLRVMVKVGDQIKKDQSVLELETDKATIEVPSSADGVVKEIKVKAGEKVKVGATIFVVEPLPDFSAWGPVERKPMNGVRRTTAHRLTQAWNTVPHVVQHDHADITAVEALRKRLSKKAEADGRARVTLTAFLVKTIAAALK